jgi:hypothetical protein
MQTGRNIGVHIGLYFDERCSLDRMEPHRHAQITYALDQTTTSRGCCYKATVYDIDDVNSMQVKLSSQQSLQLLC